MKKVWLHTTSGVDAKAFAALRSEEEVREYFTKYVELPVPLPPGKIKTIHIERWKEEDGSEVWKWGEEDGGAEIEDHESDGWLINVNGKDVHVSVTEE